MESNENDQFLEGLQQTRDKMCKQRNNKTWSQLQFCEQKVFTDILNSQINVPKDETPLPINHEVKKTNMSKQFGEIHEAKRKLEEQIRLLDYKEKQYKHKVTSSHPSNLDYSRISINKNATAEIKNIFKRKRQFEKKIKEKEEQLQKINHQQIQKQKKELEELRKASVEKKKEQIIKHLQELKRKGEEREKRKEEDKAIFKAIEAKKKLHSFLDESWRNKQKQEENKIHQLFAKRQKERKFDFQALKEHEKKYKSILEQKRLLKESVIKTENPMNQSKSFSVSKFHEMILKEENKLKQMKQDKARQKKQNKQRQLQFLEELKTNYMPKVKSEDEKKQVWIETIPKQQLPRIQLNKLGNNYLQMGNTMINRNKNSQQLNNSNVEEEKKLIKKKINYLQESRILREQNHPNKEMNITEKSKFDVQRIMNNEKLTQVEKIEEIKHLSQNYDLKKKNLVQKIKGKIQLLNAMQ